MIKLEDDRDKEKLKSLEIAANQNQFDKQKIFDIYSNISFDLDSLIKAEDIYLTFHQIFFDRAKKYPLILIDQMLAKQEVFWGIIF